MSDLSDIPVEMPEAGMYTLAGQQYWVDPEGRWFADTPQGTIHGSDLRHVVRSYLRTLNPS